MQTSKKTWFAAAVIPKVRFRPLEEREAIGFLAEASSAGKEYEPQLRILLDYLSASGLITREGGMIKIPASSFGEVPETIFPPPGHIKNTERERLNPPPADDYQINSENFLPIPLGRGRLAKVELPSDWDTAKDLDRFLQMLRLSLTEGENK